MSLIPVRYLVQSGKVKVRHKSPAEYRFWNKVDENGPIHPIVGQCWVWIGGTNSGYGVIYFNGKPWKVHRFSYYLHLGKISEGLSVLHRCDNPLCVNPEHLFIGTQVDNISDMVGKNRQKGAVGQRNKKAKLTDQEVVSIRKEYRRGSKRFGGYALGRKYGVTANMIYFIVNGNNWKHLL